MVISIFGEKAITIGPLPYDMETCQENIHMAYKPFDDDWKAGKKFIVQGREIKRKDISVKCIEKKEAII
jgi:hypothetical protein